MADPEGRVIAKPQAARDHAGSEALRRSGLKIMRKPHHQFEDYKIGDEITILRGPYEDFNGVISELIASRKLIRVKAIVSNREIILEFDAKQIRIALI